MNFDVMAAKPAEVSAEALVLFVYEGFLDRDNLNSILGDARSSQVKLLADKRAFKGDNGTALLIDNCQKTSVESIVLVGLGDASKVSFYDIQKASAIAARKCQELKAKECKCLFEFTPGLDLLSFGKAVSSGFVLGEYDFIKYKPVDDKRVDLESVKLAVSSEQYETVKSGSILGENIANAVCASRNLGNEPSNIMTPTYLADLASDISRRNNLELDIWDREKIKNEGFGLLTAVSKGSKEEPRFIRLSYRNPKASKTIAMVGKGITFDTGGYNLKTGGSIEGMKDDMSGAGDVLSAIDCIAKLNAPINVEALVPATENCIGGSAGHPGDVVMTYSGTYVEINNTDAEGRLILADSVAYACHLGANEIVDLATLTGACVSAIGTYMSGIISNNDVFVNGLLSAAERCGEKLWRLPLEQFYMRELKSNIADIRNSGGREAGPTVGALFIGKFVKDTPWAHIDLSAATQDGECPLTRNGCTGYGTGTLIEYAMGTAEAPGV